MTFLKGYKTYILGICGLLFAATGFATGHLDSRTALDLAFGSLAAMGLRNGVTNEIQSLSNLLPDQQLPPVPPQA